MKPFDFDSFSFRNFSSRAVIVNVQILDDVAGVVLTQTAWDITNAPRTHTEFCERHHLHAVRVVVEVECARLFALILDFDFVLC